MTGQSPGRGFFTVRIFTERGFFTFRGFKGGSTAALGPKRRRFQGRALGLFAAVLLGLGVVAPASLALGASPAAAASCGSSNPCAPAGVTFEQPGASILVPLPSLPSITEPVPFSDFPVCGIEGDYAPLASTEIDQHFDDPQGINSPGALDNAGGTTEGNYPDSQLVAFQPATSLQPNDTITVSLPHPAEPYQDSGAVLPSDQVSLDTLEPIEQASSTVNGPTVPGPSTAALNTSITITVTLQAGQGNALAGQTVRLDALNPYDPPALGKAPGQNVLGGTHASIPNNTATTDGNGVATFQVSDNTNEDVVFAATDVTNSNLRISQTATVSFGSGGNGSGTSVCSGSQLSAPSARAADNGFPYLLMENLGTSINPSYVGYLVPSVAVSSESGNETATLTIPPDVPIVSSGQTAYLLALDTISAPGPATPYAPDAFSVSTSEDPVPGYPSAAPTLQANYPVDGSTSTLTSSAPSAQVSTGSLTATATLLDQYNNPVSGKQVSIFQTSGTHANVSPTTAPTGGNEYPVSGNDGTVGYTVSDSCAETVNLEATDVTDNQPLTSNSGLAQQQVTFTAGPPISPDVTPTATGCGGSPTQSSVTVSAPGKSPVSGSAVNAPADGTTQATVQVTLGDQFGNADVCHQVVLSPTTKTSSATITPQPPAHPVQVASKACPNPSAGGYTGTDGVATFKVADSTAQDVVFNVTDATAPAVWPSSPAEDVAEINFEGADPGQSTVTATSPSSSSPCTTTYNSQTFTTDACAPADGQPAAAVTVTVKDGAGQLMQNQKVTLAGCTSASSPCTPDSTTTITPSSQATDNNGQATFNVSDSSAHRTVYYQATDVSGGVPITGAASIWFTAGGVSLSASPASVVADGAGTSTVTFTLKDNTGAAVSGVPVCLTEPSTAHASISPAPVPPTPPATSPPCVGTSPSASTDSNGQVTFTVTDKKAETVPFTAIATYTSPAKPCLGTLSGTTCTVTAPVNVTFITAPVTFSISPVPATNVLADGLSSSQVTVTAYDGSDPSTSNPIAGLPVSLSATSCLAPSPAATVSISPSPGQLTNTYGQVVTNSSGQATFTVTDTAAETVTLNGCYQEIGQPSGSLTSEPGSATVMFAPTEAEASTVTASPASAPADGTSAITVTVLLQSGSSNTPINGHSVVLTTGSATTTVVPENVGGITGLKDPVTQIATPGQVTFTITDTRPEANLTVYARDQNTGVILNEMPTITFTKTEAQQSTVTASPASVAAGGPLGAPRTSTVTVTLVGPIPSTCPQALSGHTVKLTSNSGTANITALSSGVTNSSGQAQFTVSDPVVENVTFTAVDTSCNNLALAQTATVNFTASEANQSTVTISPVSTPADGPAATLTVTLRAADGTPISGHTVTVPAVLHATVTPLAYPGLPAGVTNAAGQAQFAVSDNTVEMVPLVAYDGATQLDQGATVNFTANEANQSTMSATATSLPAVGGSTTVTVTLISGGGAPIAGHTVSLSGNSSTVSITPASATTNAAGQASFTVRDPNVESVVLTALDTTDGVAVVKTLPLTFTANEQNQSTTTASPTIVQVKKTSTITVTLLGANGQPLTGHAVALNTGSTTTKVTVLTAGGTTNASGQIQFSVTDTAAQTLSITVTDTTTGATLYKPVAVTFNKP